MTTIRENYHPECEAAINKQINIELYASYVYQSMVIFSFSYMNMITVRFIVVLRLVISCAV